MWLSTPIIQIMNADPVSIDVAAPFADAYRILSADRFHHLPVVESGKLVGMLATTDVVKLTYSLTPAGESSDTEALLNRLFRIADVMATDLITISERATLGEAARSLSSGGFHALPVVNSDGDLKGIVTSTDLIEHILELAPKNAPESSEGRTERLEAIYEAAKRYLHSGLAETEHARLEKAIRAIQRDR